MEFHTLTRVQIQFYIDKYKPYDKAGAYAIQEWIGVIGIKRISGDFYNVMGLPVSRVVQTLEKFRNFRDDRKVAAISSGSFNILTVPSSHNHRRGRYNCISRPAKHQSGSGFFGC